MSGLQLATLNALCNSAAMILMACGFVAIRKKRRDVHRRYMLGAFAASCLFLAGYLTRIAMYGDTHFAGQGALRIFYFVLLVSHVLLAMIAAPMVVTTLIFGLRQSVARHRKLARFALPVWAYVSVTGVVVYLMLYWS